VVLRDSIFDEDQLMHSSLFTLLFYASVSVGEAFGLAGSAMWILLIILL
jgi:hypothetical protein